MTKVDDDEIMPSNATLDAMSSGNGTKFVIYFTAALQLTCKPLARITSVKSATPMSNLLRRIASFTSMCS